MRWRAAALLAVALVVTGGCERPWDSGGSGGRSAGEQLFDQAGCAGCHTFAAAGSVGNGGPSLNGRRYDPATVARWIQDGGGTMPAYGDTLSNEEIWAVAEFVSAGSR
jgi:mono/diheme cytochrome c family protein